MKKKQRKLKATKKKRKRTKVLPTNVRSYEEWKYEVDRQFKLRTHCSWAELSGDEEPLQRAYDRNQKPQEFVVWWIEKYGLTDHSQSGGYYL